METTLTKTKNMFLLTEWPHGFCTLHSLHPYPAQVACDTFKTPHKFKKHRT